MRSKLLHSLVKVFKDKEPNYPELKAGNCLENDRYSFQIAFLAESEEEQELECFAKTQLDAEVKFYLVKNIPSEMPMYDNADTFMLETNRSEYPDLLEPIEDGGFSVRAGEWNSLWVEIKPHKGSAYNEMLSVGITPKNCGNRSLMSHSAVHEFLFRVIPKKLPEQELLFTNWFHNDCLCTWYKVKPFSAEYWTIVENYIRNAVEHGVSLLLTPVFTPPLDTEVGGERPTFQLVGIEKDGSDYKFDFTEFEKYTSLCLRCGVKAFEISHFFTQWGAAHAPKIVARVNGEEKRIFGWETEASGSEYAEFLAQFAAAFDEEVTKLGIKEKCFLHVSDEPNEEQFESYKAASDLVHSLFRGYRWIDALSDIEFYKNGLVETPVCCENAADVFKPEVKNFWTYYCCGQVRNNLPNRMFAMPSVRNRILGVLLYKYNAEGFLQWGHNFWYSQYSKREIDPFEETAAGAAFPSGDAFVVYPGKDGKPLNSLRHEVFSDAINDLRALKLLESLKGREFVLDLIERGLDIPLSFNEYPHNADWILNIRSTVNELIGQSVRR